ncbi:MAG: FAD-dependent oxidoreductase [Synergistaceae bacterium]|jgi:heterodisulfide reductase subunit A-like polyferredoxin|nr:FAD-dependent oxidoreductase [Synergistaceae bacterium]
MRKPVLVLGGGIAGIQASTDLADMGIPVFLVESGPSIGGRMAALDKTFPTNDCSACILAPKVTSCFNHPLVITLTLSDLIGLEGDAPNLRAAISRRPRYVDEDICNGCDDCSKVCPVKVKSEFDMGMGERTAIYKPFAQAVPNKAVIDKKGSSPCKYNCPARLDAHGYIALIAEERYDDALKVVRRTTPFSGVLGRICFHPCENGCARQYVESSISIASLKRFIADREASLGEKPKLPAAVPLKDDKIAIVGAGPAGLNCAYRLLLEGYRPVVFEERPEPGGMLRYGIPDFRLDKEVLRREIEMITDMGAEIRTGLSLGSDFTIESLKSDGYRAIFVAIGACVDMKLGIPGENHERVTAGIDFLRAVNLGERPYLGRKAAVIGGGNVAVDAARACVRLGCETVMVYRRTRAEMPANEWELRHALDEGVAILELASPKEAAADSEGRLRGLVCVKNELGPPDSSGRKSPVPVGGSDFMIEADTIIVAAGQKVDSGAAARGGLGNFERSGNIRTDESLNAGAEGVFAGGDAVRGPATAIEAIADGNSAAAAIINYLEGRNGDVRPFALPQTPLESIDTGSKQVIPRAAMPMIEMKRRTAGFDEVEIGYDERTALAEARRCLDCSICCECRMCEEACRPASIRHNQTGEVFELNVSAVILAAGYEASAELPPELGYGRYADVVTSLEYERILSASGPFAGHIKRPSDGKPPERIAFIQCAGSRDIQCGAPYCSAVCCMYAAKEASITKEHLPGVRAIDIFYMEMRAYGKDFDRYIETAKSKYGVNFIRSRVGGVTRDALSGEIVISYCSENGVSFGRYDMAVLSVGMKPDEKNRTLYGRIGVRTDIHGFVRTDDLGAPATSRDGVTVCGAAAGPKDIPETVVEASAAAAICARFAGGTDANLYEDPVYGRFFKKIPAVPERDVSRDPIRVGVFVCHCGVNIGGYLAVREVVEHARTLPFVSFADESLFTCSVDAQKTISERIAEYGLNRVVVASCTPRTHEPLFRNVLMSAGLNPYLFTMANIRDQCSWVHMEDRASATEKAKELVTMAVGKAIGAKQLVRKKIPVEHAALVIGGGVTGMKCAMELSGMGYHVHIAERGPEFGGHARSLAYDRAGRPMSPRIDDLIQSVLNDRNIEIHTSSIISSIDGYVGNFKTTVETENGTEEISHGVVIVAVGAEETIPDGFGWGSGAVVTHTELERRLREPDVLAGLRSVAMIQCVGSRDETRPYCSRVCCGQALRNAIYIKLKYPGCDVSILFREMRCYGVNEDLYAEARKLGVRFIRFADGNYPSVRTKGARVLVKTKDLTLDAEVILEADILSLAAAMRPNMEENLRLARMLKIPLNQDGFFLEAHAKLRPVDFATEGVYLAGLAHSPKGLRECVVQGRAAAARAATVLSRDFLETDGAIARVDTGLCSACGACADVCAYGAVSVEDVAIRRITVKKAVVNEVLCKGCGTCSAVCRCGAIDVNGFSDTQVMNELEYLLRGAPCGCV